MNIFIIPNIVSERYVTRVLESIHQLEKKGYECFLSEEDVSALSLPDRNKAKQIEGCDIIVTLGGDGTFLRGVQPALEHDKPICGINCGHLGYLCTYDYDNIDECDFQSLMEKEVDLLEYDDGNRHYALNDFVIGKDYFGGTISLRVKVNGEKKYDFIGDGLIVSSPLGSTAYNKSAGGMILEHDSGSLAVTPICSYSSGTESFVIGRDDTVEVELLKQIYKASAYADGVYVSGFVKAKISSSDVKIRMLVK
ncbi:MAG: NAD(+)/NADH kinase [Erysipelotrichaceae bacterium]|nr:NAD(+)/NADH kinase [Erysipelotrichaceae bacterium]